MTGKCNCEIEYVRSTCGVKLCSSEKKLCSNHDLFTVGYTCFLRHNNVILICYPTFGFAERVWSSSGQWCAVRGRKGKLLLGKAFSSDPEGDGPKIEKERPEISNDCSYCHALEPKGSPFKICSGCRSVSYCDETCQNMHWNQEHREQCENIQAGFGGEHRERRPAGVCFYFQQGRCDRGDGCRFSHDNVTGGGRGWHQQQQQQQQSRQTNKRSPPTYFKKGDHTSPSYADMVRKKPTHQSTPELCKNARNNNAFENETDYFSSTNEHQHQQQQLQQQQQQQQQQLQQQQQQQQQVCI